MSEKELNIREEVRQKVKERTKVCRALQQKINEELDELHKLIQIKKIQAA